MCCQQNALSPHFCRQRLDFFQSARLHNLESRLKQVGAISENLPRFEVLQKPSADVDCQWGKLAGGWWAAASVSSGGRRPQPGAQLGPISCCSIKGGSLGTSPTAASLVWGSGRFFQCSLVFFGGGGGLGLPNVQLTFSLGIWSPFVESAAVWLIVSSFQTL